AFRETLPDRRLELLFLCAHPDIDPSIRTPLMLQTVLGVKAERIAGAMLVKPATMGQRLSRAKRKLAEQNLPLSLPEPEALPKRTAFVLDAIYAAFGTAWFEGREAGLVSEAIWLARLVVERLPESAEALGLYSLMLHCEARRDARIDSKGAFVPLEAQDTKRWDTRLILEAEKALWLAARFQRPGAYQLEASIQSHHAHRARGGSTNWDAIHHLYGVLVRLYPSLGAFIGRAASFGRMGRAAEGLALLDGLEEGRTQLYQPYWAVRAHLLRELQRDAEAKGAYEKAAGLATGPVVTWLLRQASALAGD
ncbi:MAG: DUF6596 domain-containing protein, partial [Myxococcota bacterium]